MNNNISINKMEAFIALNPEMVGVVLDAYGISNELPLSAETIVIAFTLHGEPFARDLYEAVAGNLASGLKDANSSAWDWEVFFNGLIGLAEATPAIITASREDTFSYEDYLDTNININILTYVSIAVAVIVVMVVVFKKA